MFRNIELLSGNYQSESSLVQSMKCKSIYWWGLVLIKDARIQNLHFSILVFRVRFLVLSSRVRSLGLNLSFREVVLKRRIEFSLWWSGFVLRFAVLWSRLLWCLLFRFVFMGFKAGILFILLISRIHWKTSISTFSLYSLPKSTPQLLTPPILILVSSKYS